MILGQITVSNCKCMTQMQDIFQDKEHLFIFLCKSFHNLSQKIGMKRISSYTFLPNLAAS